MRETKISRGQRFQKVDGTGIVFEVIELVERANMPHARLSRMDNTGEERVFALTALLDKRMFVPASAATVPVRKQLDTDGLALEPAPGD